MSPVRPSLVWVDVPEDWEPGDQLPDGAIPLSAENLNLMMDSVLDYVDESAGSSSNPIQMGISGTAIVGNTLTGWGPADEGTHFWYRGSSLIPGADQKNYVVAGADAGSSIAYDWRPSVQVASTSQVPGIITDLKGTAGNAVLNLTLTEPNPGGNEAVISRYEITYNGGASVSTIGLGTAGEESTKTFTVAATNGATYAVAVRAVNAQGAGPWSNTVSGLQPKAPTSAPGAPGTPVLTKGNAMASGVFTPPTTGDASTGYEWQKTGTSTWTPITVTASGANLLFTISATNGVAISGKVRGVNGAGAGVASSTSNSVTPAVPSTPTPGSGIYLPIAVADLSKTSQAYKNMAAWADTSKWDAPNAGNQDANYDQQVLGAAWTALATNDASLKQKVAAGLMAAIDTHPNGDKRALGIGRNMGAYALAADAIDFKTLDPAKFNTFSQWLTRAMNYATSSGPKSTRISAGERPNNWGTWALFAGIAIAALQGDEAEMAYYVKILKRWLGDENAGWTGYKWGADTWMLDGAHPKGINAAGTKSVAGGTRDIGGVIPEEQRREATAWPPPSTKYVPGVLEGIMGAVQIVRKVTGENLWPFQSNALKRAMDFYVTTWHHDDQWGAGHAHPSWIINQQTGSSYPTQATSLGHGISFADWTHNPA